MNVGRAKRRAEELSQKSQAPRKDLRANLQHVKKTKVRKVKQPRVAVLPGSLSELGYEVFPQAVEPSPKLCDAALRSAADSFVIFNHNARTRANDDLRSQSHVKVTERLLRGIDELLKPFEHSGLKRSEFVAIHSAPGCQEQAAHCDFDPKLPCFATGAFPVGVIVALQDETFVDVWPQSHLSLKTKIERHKITLSKGDVLVFRGDCVHAGSAFAEANTRLHCYIDSGKTQLSNLTWPIKRPSIDPF